MNKIECVIRGVIELLLCVLMFTFVGAVLGAVIGFCWAVINVILFAIPVSQILYITLCSTLVFGVIGMGFSVIGLFLTAIFG